MWRAELAVVISIIIFLVTPTFYAADTTSGDAIPVRLQLKWRQPVPVRRLLHGIRERLLPTGRLRRDDHFGNPRHRSCRDSVYIMTIKGRSMSKPGFTLDGQPVPVADPNMLFLYALRGSGDVPEGAADEKTKRASPGRRDLLRLVPSPRVGGQATWRVPATDRAIAQPRRHLPRLRVDDIPPGERHQTGPGARRFGGHDPGGVGRDFEVAG